LSAKIFLTVKKRRKAEKVSEIWAFYGTDGGPGHRQNGDNHAVWFVRVPRHAQTFQRFMDSLLKHLPFVFCYMDDIIIASNSLEEHIEHLRQIFTILQENGLQINPAKCVFAAAAVDSWDTE
jgi:hypothetical protein